MPNQNTSEAAVAGICKVEIIAMFQMPITEKLCSFDIAPGIIKRTPTLTLSLIERNEIARDLCLAIIAAF